MTTTNSNNIQKLYVAYFNRPADPAGLAYWEKVVDAQMGNTDAVSGAFAASAEYRTSFAGMSNAAIVNKIYLNLFGRAAEPAGVTFWSDLLAANKVTVASIVKNIADGAQLSDLTAIGNKVLAATAFTAALDTDAELDGFTGPDVAVKAKAFITAITTDASLTTALQPANLNAAVLSVLGTGQTVTLTKEVDTLGVNDLNDIYLAPLIDGQNTLQSSDSFGSGQGERDVLRAELGNYLDTAVKPDLTTIDVVELKAVASPATGTGALSDRTVRFDATEGFTVDAWTSQRSSVDLEIEHVRLPYGKSTSDVTVTMRETDAGDVDFGVYFDPYSPVDQGKPDSVLRLRLMDVRGASDNSPLAESPYSGFAFYFNGVLTKVSSPAINAAMTYDQLVLAVRAAVAATPGLENIQVEKGANFEAFDTLGKVVTGSEVLMTSSVDSDTFSLGINSGVTTPPGLVPSSDVLATLYTFDNGQSEVASTIVLDDVGRGGTAGELEVGNMIGDGFADGIERFNIEVRDSSKLESIESTNNALREVFIKNGITTSHGATGVPNQGSLSVVEGSGFGFTDVRVIDGSAMSGKLSFNAEITSATIAKYKPTYFVYSGGLNDDSIQVAIDGGVLVGHESPHYSFTANGGGGNDAITLTMSSLLPDWYAAQRGLDNVTINGGNGDDVVRVLGSGDVIVNLGAGDDTVYTANANASDNTLSGGAGNDRLVLGTTVGLNEANSSNDTLVYAGADFGHDVVVNFNGGSGLGADQLDLRALGGVGVAFAGAAVTHLDKSITVQAESGANDSAAEIAALYADGASASYHVFIAVTDGVNLGKVYTVADSAAGAVVVALVGTIDLSATAWGTLTAANFV